MKTQKNELQRQRDALQRQIDLFEAQRRHWMNSAELRAIPPTTSRPCPVPRFSASASSEDGTEAGRVRNAEPRSEPPERHLSPVGQAGAGGRRTLARVGSAGNVAAVLDNRAVPRVSSAGNLVPTWPLPVHLMSATNESRLLAGGKSNPLRSTISLPGAASIVPQLFPSKLSGPSNSPTKTARDQRGSVDPKKTSSGAATATEPGKNWSPAAAGGGRAGSRDRLRSAGTTSANILPMKLVDGRREVSRSTSAAAQFASCRSTADDDDDVRCKENLEPVRENDDDSDVIYF